MTSIASSLSVPVGDAKRDLNSGRPGVPAGAAAFTEALAGVSKPATPTALPRRTIPLQEDRASGEASSGSVSDLLALAQAASQDDDVEANDVEASGAAREAAPPSPSGRPGGKPAAPARRSAIAEAVSPAATDAEPEQTPVAAPEADAGSSSAREAAPEGPPVASFARRGASVETRDPPIAAAQPLAPAAVTLPVVFTAATPPEPRAGQPSRSETARASAAGPGVAAFGDPAAAVQPALTRLDTGPTSPFSEAGASPSRQAAAPAARPTPPGPAAFQSPPGQADPKTPTVAAAPVVPVRPAARPTAASFSGPLEQRSGPTDAAATVSRFSFRPVQGGAATTPSEPVAPPPAKAVAARTVSPFAPPVAVPTSGLAGRPATPIATAIPNPFDDPAGSSSAAPDLGAPFAPADALASATPVPTPSPRPAAAAAGALPRPPAATLAAKPIDRVPPRSALADAADVQTPDPQPSVFGSDAATPALPQEATVGSASAPLRPPSPATVARNEADAVVPQPAATGAHGAENGAAGQGKGEERQPAPSARPEAFAARPEAFAARPETFAARPETFAARPLDALAPAGPLSPAEAGPHDPVTSQVLQLFSSLGLIDGSEATGTGEGTGADTQGAATVATTTRPASLPDTVTLQLAPEALGRITVTLRMRGQAVDVRLVADKRAALESLGRDRHQLEAALGVTADAIDIALAAPSVTAGSPGADAGPPRGGGDAAGAMREQGHGRSGDRSPGAASSGGDGDVNGTASTEQPAERRDGSLYL